MLPKPIRYKLNASILSIGASYAKFNSTAKSTQKSVILLDSNYNLYELCEGEFIFNKKIFDYEPQHQFSKACALSQNGYVAIGEPHSSNCHILHLYNGILTRVRTLSWHKADIYNIRFSKNGKYMVSGGEDGKVFIYGMPHFNIIAILPPRPDYISNIHFGKSQNLVVYSSYDNVNCIFDMETNKIIGEFETRAVAEDMTFFDDDTKIFFICANGESGIYDIQKQALSLRKNYNAWLTRAGMTKDDNFAYIGSRDRILRYLDLAKNKGAFEVVLDNEGIASMRVIDAKLYIGFVSGSLEIFDLRRFEAEFNSALQSRDLPKAQEISSQNIPLKTFKSYIALKDSLWVDALKKAQEILGENKEAFAKVLSSLQIFFEDEDKKLAFDELIQNIGVLRELNEAMRAKDYALSYEIISKNPHLKETSYFERLEKLYNDAFEGAKELLLHNDLEDKTKAQDLLKPFQNVPQLRDGINALLRSAGKFKEAELLFKNKQFGEFFKLAESFSAIKGTINYKKALSFGEQILATINELEAKGANQKALDLLEVLEQFLPLQNSALARKNDILLKLEFLEFFAKKEYKKIYVNIHKYRIFKGLGEYVALSNRLNDIFERALLSASEGACEAVYKDLKPYLDIEYLENKLASIFNIAYLGEIERIAESSADSANFAESNNAESINWRATLEQYIAMFGKSDELLKILPQDKLTICDKIPVEGKKEVEFLETIVIYK